MGNSSSSVVTDKQSYSNNFVSRVIRKPNYKDLIDEYDKYVYSGTLRNSSRNGKGKIEVFKDGKIVSSYDGEWKDNKYNGRGKYTHNDLKYEGMFSDGRIHGYGILSVNVKSSHFNIVNGEIETGCKDTKEFIYGNWSLEGDNWYTIDSGISCIDSISLSNVGSEGKFRYNILTQQLVVVDGTSRFCVLTNGDDYSYEIYSGKIKNDLLHGEGAILYNNKDKYIGEFYNGCKHGKGNYTYSNGEKYQQTYNHGVLIKNVRIGFTEEINNQSKDDDDVINSIKDEPLKCNICCANDKNILFEPCKHVYLCSECSELVTECPICRTTITSTTTIYIS